MQRIKFIVSYDGTDYCGWQRQKDPNKQVLGKPSLQETLETALATVFNEKISLSASGRTDAGVHALAQVCHFDIDRSLPKDFCWAIRPYLPKSISIKNAFLAPSDFHATLSANRKTYKYWIWNEKRPTALLDRYSYWVRKPLDLIFLNECSQYLIGTHDFKSFQSAGSPVTHTQRKIFSAKWSRQNSSLIEFEITGNGFLKQMVRNIVGTQIDLAIRNIPAQKIEEIIKYKDRTKSGPTAPPQGLFLKKVYYPIYLNKQCKEV